ncbi:MAG: PilZ domain-containing protein [Termitinemataceae bacterium]|nr:MAG: PilZ domain-containing protein [Termitinemataceae bacterium]
MGNLTRQKIQTFYDQFKTIPITFTKEIIQVTGLQAKQVSIKCTSDFFPCVIYSTNFEEAKLVANSKSGIMERFKETNNSASIKFSFKVPSTGEQVAFLVPVHMSGCSPYNGSEEMTMFTMQFSQRPPDDLIEIVGRVIEANWYASKRKDEAIPVNAETLRKLKFITKDVGITVEGVPRRCILRDISISGARIIVLGISKMLVGKSGSIKFEFTDPIESYEIKGTYASAESVADRKDMAVLNLQYIDPIPLTYKVRLSEYLGTNRKPAAAPHAAAAAVAAPAVETPAQETPPAAAAVTTPPK